MCMTAHTYKQLNLFVLDVGCLIASVQKFSKLVNTLLVTCKKNLIEHYTSFESTIDCIYTA